MIRIGYIGLGAMGFQMAARLIHAGYDLIVYNRTRGKMEPLLQLGAQPAADIATLSADCDVICTCLSCLVMS